MSTHNIGGGVLIWTLARIIHKPVRFDRGGRDWGDGAESGWVNSETDTPPPFPPGQKSTEVRRIELLRKVNWC